MINNTSEMARFFWETGKLPCGIMDFHAHMDEHAEIYFPFSSADDMVRDMDRNGVRTLFFCGHHALYDPIEGERYNVDAVRRYPDRLRAYHIIHPRFADPKRDIAEVEQNPDVYVGFKLLGDYARFPVDDESLFPYYDYLCSAGKLLLLHTWDGSGNDGYRNVLNVVSRFPDLTVICGHSFFHDCAAAIGALKPYPNVYFELTAIPIVRGYLERIVQTAGSGRVLFGTDLPWFSTMHGAGMVLGADISDDDRRNIFYRNGEKICERLNLL